MRTRSDFGAWLARHQDIAFDPDTMFDVQAKRLHEYKRQLLNVLHILVAVQPHRGRPHL